MPKDRAEHPTRATLRRETMETMRREGARVPHEVMRAEAGEAPGPVFEPPEEEILGLMRPWLASDPDSRLWVAAIHRRGGGYARRQLWQVRLVLWDRMRRDLSSSTDPDGARHLLLREEPLLAALLRASRALDGAGAASRSAPMPDRPTP